MAWSFDETTQNVQIADNAALTLPDADWSVGGRVKLDDNTGSAFQYFFSWNNFNLNPTFQLFFREASAADPNKLKVRIEDTSLNLIEFVSSGTPGTSTAWQHLMIIRSGSTVSMYVDNVFEGSQTDAAFHDVDFAGDLFLGARFDQATDRQLGGDMAEWAKWDRALNASERAALAAGASPVTMPNSLKWHCDMVREYRELINGLTVTNSSSTIGPHPPIFRPSAQILQFPPAAGGITVNMGLLTETDLAQSLGKAKARAIGLTTEADL
ncbi:hypothetical protein LCGC14_2682310, partial [marine sediment metagenome]